MCINLLIECWVFNRLRAQNINNMRISYYNSDKDEIARNRDRKRKIFTISFYNRILEDIQLEISYRGRLLWIATPKTIRVFGFWNKNYSRGVSQKIYQHWENDHNRCSL